jgi:hypothetical protein
MSRGQTAIRVISFGDPDGELWGTVVDAGRPALVLGDGTNTVALATAVTVGTDQDAWVIAADGVELRATPTSPETDGDQLCEVSGTVTLDGHQHEVQCVGVRRLTNAGDPAIGSLRGLSGWFAADRATTLLSLRPAGGKNAESDRVAATIFEPDGTLAVDDPRLSTTLLAGARPSRANLELWIGEGDEQYPRRLASEAAGEPATITGDGIELQVTPVRCHAAGLDGAGVYLAARFQ